MLDATAGQALNCGKPQVPSGITLGLPVRRALARMVCEHRLGEELDVHYLLAPREGQLTDSALKFHEETTRALVECCTSRGPTARLSPSPG